MKKLLGKNYGLKKDPKALRLLIYYEQSNVPSGDYLGSTISVPSIHCTERGSLETSLAS